VLVDCKADGLAVADLIFVFGTRHWTPAEVAAALYKRSLSKTVVVTGGPDRDPESLPEAHRHRDLLVAAGVPASSVIVEDKSVHTLENVTLARPLIESALGEVRTVIAVTKWYHRRAVVLLAQHMPSLERIYVADYAPFNTDRGISLTRETWEDSCPRSVAKETQYLREMQANGSDLLTRSSGGGWVRSQG
jgi:hypothetical protein